MEASRVSPRDMLRSRYHVNYYMTPYNFIIWDSEIFGRLDYHMTAFRYQNYIMTRSIVAHIETAIFRSHAYKSGYRVTLEFVTWLGL